MSSAPFLSALLGLSLAAPTLRAPAQDAAEQSSPSTESPAAESSASESPGEAAKAALKEAPRKSKIGKVRGMQATSEVRFLTAPDDAYELVASFGIPARARIVLSNESGSFARFQLGTRLFGRDSQKGTESSSFVLQGQGLLETQIDIELRRALFFWPDAPRFVGAGRTFTSQLGNYGVLVATVDESTGLPSSIQSYGKDGGAGAEFQDIQWSRPDGEADRPRPTAFDFAAGGQVLWKETVEAEEFDWRFADTWFVPADCLTAVLGSEVEGQMHVRALEGAWFYRVPIGDLAPPKAGSSKGRWAAITKAAEEWTRVRQRPEIDPEGKSIRALSPYVSLVLDPVGEPFAVEFESMKTTREQGAGAADWKWRKPRNVWAYPLEAPKSGSKIEPFKEATQALASFYADERGLKPLQRIRFRVGEERLNGKAKAVGVDLVLNIEVPLTDDATRDPAGHKK